MNDFMGLLRWRVQIFAEVHVKGPERVDTNGSEGNSNWMQIVKAFSQ